MTKRAKAKTTVPAAHIINSTAPTEAVESVKQETNTKVASKPKQANTTAKKASTGGRRGRPKKVVVEKPVPPEGRVALEHQMPAPVSKAVDVDSRTITYVDPMTMAAKQEPEPSLYDRFVGWLTYKLYYYTSYFRGY